MRMTTLRTMLIFIAVAAGILTFRAVTGLPRGTSPPVRHAPARQIDFDADGDVPDHQHPRRFGNQQDPAAYVRAYEAVKRMPDERSFSGKKGRVIDVSSTQWECIGPARIEPAPSDPTGYSAFGRIRCMHWYYDNGSSSWVPYLGSSSGGLWVGNFLLTKMIFTSLGDNLPNPSVGAFVINPVDPNTIFVGTGDWGWPFNPRYSGSGLYRTTDRGVSWQRISITSGDAIPAAITQILYLVGSSIMILSSDAGVFRSTDGGNSWNLATVEPTAPYAPCYNLVASTPALLFAGLPTRGIYRSTDGGSSWSKLTNGLPTTNVGTTLAIDAARSNPEFVYAAFPDSSDNTGRIYRSTNSGTSWTALSATPSYMVNGQGFHVNVIRVHPNDENTVYAASVSMVRTTDGGTTWIELPRGPARGHDDITSIEVKPDAPGLIYICGDGGVYQRDDAANTGSNDQFLFAPGAPTQEYGMDYAWSEPNVIVSGTQDNGTIMTDEASNPMGRWWTSAGCDGPNDVSIDPRNAALVFSNQWCGKTQPRLRSTDQGASWVNINQDLPEIWYTPIQYNHAGAEYLWTVTSTSLYWSYNQGETWNPSVYSSSQDFPNGAQAAPRELCVNNYAPVGKKVAYVSFWDQQQSTIMIAEGVPGSMTWRTTSLPYHLKILNLVPDRADPDWVFGLADFSEIYLSTDRGNSWNNITGDFPNGPMVNTIVSQDGRTFFLGTNMGMFKTIDGGAHWFTFQEGLPVVSISNIAFIYGNGYDTLRIGTFGRGFWQRLIKYENNRFITVQAPSGILNDVGSSSGFGLAVGDSGYVGTTTDTGKSWNFNHIPVHVNLRRGTVIDPLHALIGGAGGFLARSTDGGGSWLPIAGVAGSDCRDMSFIPGGTGWVLTAGGQLIKTLTGGIDWQPVHSFSPMQGDACCFTDPLHGWVSASLSDPAAGTIIMMYSTTDGGSTWNGVPLPRHVNRMQFTDTLNGFGACDTGGVIRTTDGGNHWTLVSTGSTGNLEGCFFSDRLTGWVCGSRGALFTTGDGGKTWTGISPDTSGEFRAIGILGGNLISVGANTMMSADQTQQVAIPYSLNAGWNMVSLPVLTGDSSPGEVFPMAYSHLFGFGAGYTIESSLSPGRGYWIKFRGDTAAVVSGAVPAVTSIPVVPGWNLIGSFPHFTPTSSLVATPAGILTSVVFEYNRTYAPALTLQPGRGYWIKASQAGTITVGAPSPVPADQQRLDMLSSAESITFSAGDGRHQSVFIGGAPGVGYEMPPLPPDGGFDVRFANGTFVAGPGAAQVQPIRLATDSWPVTVSWYPGSVPGGNVLAIDGQTYDLGAPGYAVIAGRPATLEIRLRAGAGTEIPTLFALSQNYPNPFNPSTSIRYELPVASHVSLVVYNAIGERVMTLRDGTEQAGIGSAHWSADGLASGVYFFRMDATGIRDPGRKFSMTRKALLIR